MDQQATLGATRAGVANKSRKKTMDWISEPRAVELTPFQQFTVDVDWEKSPLGPMKGWSKQLRSMVLLCFADPKPAVVMWGDNNAIVYNEPYTQIIGRKHPAMQGQDPCIELAEIWDYFGALLERQKDTGEAVLQEDALLLLHRHGFEEETYMTYKYVPIVCDEGYVIAIHATLDETTRQVLGDRRMFIIRALGERLSKAKTIRDLWDHLIQGLELAEKDAPFCLLYSASESSKVSNPLSSTTAAATTTTTTTTTTSAPSVPCVLEGSVGIPEGHYIAPPSFDVTYDQNWLARPFERAMTEMKTILVPLDLEVKQNLGGIKCRGFGEPSHVAVCPLMDSETQSVLAFLVLALNPRRPYDRDYQEWIQMLSHQVTTPQVSAIILRQEVKRRLALAKQEALDRATLSQQLTESETNFTRFATRTPVGLAILTSEGTALLANDLWRSQTSLDIGSSKVNWEKVLMPGEFEPLTTAWSEVVNNKNSRTFQSRFKKPWKAQELNTDGEEQWTETHLLIALYPDLDDEGNVSTIMSCITEISELKWSENQLRARMEQALEMKQQQERFIDMTSHEMRNPLSALIGCADEILSSLHEYKNLMNSSGENGKILSTELPINLIDGAIEATDTIIYCAMHQKRIIDDILTLSRLDTNLLVVSPEASQPVQIINSALKMFESELKQADTKLDFIQADSIKELKVHWTLLDPSRVLQVLLNLMTNAIKFTRTEKLRQITVTMAASLEKPSSQKTIVEYVPKRRESSDQTFKGEWGNGEILYLSITVTDSGRGLSEKEKANLFHLFMQASPKTHVQYGGSGLGLFISRQLTEMQGGEIGVHSERGKGSTFQFYVKTRRTTAPVDMKDSEEGIAKDFQMTLREDALREACGFEMPDLNHDNPSCNCAGKTTVTKQDALKLPMRPLPVRKRSSRLRVSRLNNGTKKGGKDQEQLNVLVVEDNLLNQKVLVKSLRKEGFGVSVANHGGEALDFLKGTRFWVGDAGRNGGDERKSKKQLDLILMDLEMPIMDGTTCVKQIRKWEAEGSIAGHVPIIAVTANARKDQIMSTIDAGMDDVTTKPYRIQDMLKQIERLVRQHSDGGIDTPSLNGNTSNKGTTPNTSPSNLRTLNEDTSSKGISNKNNSTSNETSQNTSTSDSRTSNKGTLNKDTSNTGISNKDTSNADTPYRNSSTKNTSKTHISIESTPNGII
ncbi:putative histidine kinase M2QJp [Sclerotinia borealis F-4128]|uniref:Putative histidine kinase M2QJp n=1 Tax=Sclerotinia borealis (strain F-4128) TaxID=1432307 RepID=W9C823_SCLBF|nr:putative histidine kinase M2QJp [Sclerotinia borealis F-4128]